MNWISYATVGKCPYFNSNILNGTMDEQRSCGNYHIYNESAVI